MSLYGEDSTLGVGNGLLPGKLAHQALPIFKKCHH
jgi:hypothetical protein